MSLQYPTHLLCLRYMICVVKMREREWHEALTSDRNNEYVTWIVRKASFRRQSYKVPADVTLQSTNEGR